MKKPIKHTRKSPRPTPPPNPPGPLGSIQAGELLTLVEPGPLGSIQAGELVTLAELKRRLRWGEHAVRMAREAGLRLIPFGREKFALGSDVLRFFRRLGDEQTRHSNEGGDK